MNRDTGTDEISGINCKFYGSRLTGMVSGFMASDQQDRRDREVKRR